MQKNTLRSVFEQIRNVPLWKQCVFCVVLSVLLPPVMVVFGVTTVFSLGDCHTSDACMQSSVFLVRLYFHVLHWIVALGFLWPVLVGLIFLFLGLRRKQHISARTQTYASMSEILSAKMESDRRQIEHLENPQTQAAGFAHQGLLTFSPVFLPFALLNSLIFRCLLIPFVSEAVYFVNFPNIWHWMAIPLFGLPLLFVGYGVVMLVSVAGCAASFAVVLFSVRFGKRWSTTLRFVSENQINRSLQMGCGCLFFTITMLIFVFSYRNTTLPALSTAEVSLLMSVVSFFEGWLMPRMLVKVS